MFSSFDVRYGCHSTTNVVCFFVLCDYFHVFTFAMYVFLVLMLSVVITQRNSCLALRGCFHLLDSVIYVFLVLMFGMDVVQQKPSIVFRARWLL